MYRYNSDLIFIGIKGSVLALNKITGQEVWQTKLKGQYFVNLVIENENLYATTQGEIFCLETRTGNLRWHNKLKGLGLGLVSIATHATSQALTAEEILAAQRAAAAGAASAAS